MHLAYIDDSDTKSKECKWQVMAGILIPDVAFRLLEMAMGLVQNLLIPENKLAQFEEFHACELYGGYEAFQGIEQEIRFEAIRRLLDLLNGRNPLKVVYGAVNIDDLKGTIYASADPLDMSFRMCVDGIQSYMAKRVYKRAGIPAADVSEDEMKDVLRETGKPAIQILMEELVLLIVDNCDKKTKDILYQSFRALRPRMLVPRKDGPVHSGALFHFHDDMYFSDSRYSLGIQLADLCAYFIARHLKGDVETEGFYKLIEPHIVFSQTHPETHIHPTPPQITGDTDGQ